MKHGKRPTVRQRKYLKSLRLNYDNWLVCKDTPGLMIIEHRDTGTVREIHKDRL